MRGQRLSIDEQQAEVARLEALQRTRALTADESAWLENLLYREQQRAYRLHAQLQATRAKLARLEARAA